MTKWILSACALTLLPGLYAEHSTGSGAQLTTAQIVAARVARLTKLLTLTTAQQNSATTIFTTEQTALDALETNFTTAETALQTAIKANNAAGISTAATQIGNLTAQEELAKGTAEAAFYALLTAEQKTLYDTLRLAGFDGHGPGGGH